MQKVRSLRIVMLRLQVMGILGSVLILGGTIGSIRFESPSAYGGNLFLALAPTSVSVSALILGLGLMGLYFWWFRNLRCPECRTLFPKKYASQTTNQSTATFVYKCVGCDTCWDTGISTGAW